MFKFWKKPLDITEQADIIPSMQPSNQTPNTKPTGKRDSLPSRSYNLLSPIQLASDLTGRTVRYETANQSSVTSDGTRTFKIKSVEDVSVSDSTGNRYVTAKVQDVDDGGTEKYRSLIVERISIVV